MPRDVSGTKAASRSTTQEAAAPVWPKAGDDLDQTDGGGGGNSVQRQTTRFTEHGRWLWHRRRGVSETPACVYPLNSNSLIPALISLL